MAAGSIDGGLDVARGGVDVAAKVELQDELVPPSPLEEVISVTPAMRPN